MNIIESSILIQLKKNNTLTQRDLSNKLDCSLGMINKSIKNLKDNLLLDDNNALTSKANELLNTNKPKNAIILAAGIGMQMTPISKECPKGLLQINNIPIIENIINKLHDKEIKEIYIIVGYLKEQYEYLIDKYNVKLLVNNKYYETNNIYSLYLARKYINNSYIIPCDIYIENNPFNNLEINSWYLVSNNIKTIQRYKISKNKELKSVNKDYNTAELIGISYINNKDSNILTNYFNNISDDNIFTKKDYYWENIILNELNINIDAKSIPGITKEINNFDDLRSLDPMSSSLRTEIINIITDTLNIDIFDINNISLSKKGMTNRSFLFETKDGKYIMRLPGEGTDQLINRKEEYDIYQTINKYHISDDVIYFNPNNGYKLTKFIEGSRNCNPYDINDLNLCMKFLKEFHDKQLQVNHTFDIFDKIDYYQSLWNNNKSLYNDYNTTKNHVLELKNIIDKLPQKRGLTHIDAVPDNFLIYDNNKVRLIDWEYAGMQDCHSDIAFFCIYALYDKEHVDKLIDIYFDNNCPKNIRLKIYCYIAICGLLWSNWCEYKYQLGVEFGEYSLAQYRYAKDYYHYALKYMEDNNICIK